MADARVWFALTIRETGRGDACVAPPTGVPTAGDHLAFILDDYAPVAIEDLQPIPIPPGGLWDPTMSPAPEPPAAPLAWRVFFATADHRSAAADALRNAFPAIGLVSEDVHDEDWAARSQQQLTAIIAGDVIVAPPWDSPVTIPPHHTLVVIEPSRGFGTGHHPSTRLCLRALSSVDVRGLRVLDIGTGSGVLAMAAALRGAARVVGVDVDEDAIGAARGSQTLNPGAAAVEWLIADYRDTPVPASLQGEWDVVLANLTGGLLRSSASRIRDIVGPRGVLIASGFGQDERAAVETALALDVHATLVEDSWVGLLVRR